jgi:hypothetical protein
MRRREFITLLGAALSCSVTTVARLRAQQLSPANRSAAPERPVAQAVPPPPVPQMTPQLNVPGPQIAPSAPGNPVQQLAPLRGANTAVGTGRIRRGRAMPRRSRLRRSK